MAQRHSVVQRRRRAGGPRPRPVSLPRRASRRGVRGERRLPRRQPGRRGRRDLGWAHRRGPLRGLARGDRGLHGHRVRADHELRRRPDEGLAVTHLRSLRQPRRARRRGAATSLDGPQDLARLRALSRRRARHGAEQRGTPRPDHLHVREQAHVGPRGGAALVSHAQRLRPDRPAARALEAHLSPRLPAAVPGRQPRAVARRVAHGVDATPAGHRRPGMDFLAEGLRRAFALIVRGDTEVYGIALLTFKVALTATVVACALGLPFGFMLATKPFWGRRAALTVVNTALAFPTVVVGLLLYGLLSRRGPLGGLGRLYTCEATVIGDVLLALPVAAALSAAAVQGVDPRIRRTAQTLGAGPWRTAWTVAREAGFALAAVITAAFGHVSADIGSTMIVGGNIRGQTRTLTTAVALYTEQGDFGLALALGIILLLLALMVNVGLQVLQGRGGGGGGGGGGAGGA